jgi:hypothetical protein
VHNVHVVLLVHTSACIRRKGSNQNIGLPKETLTKIKVPQRVSEGKAQTKVRLQKQTLTTNKGTQRESERQAPNKRSHK